MVAGNQSLSFFEIIQNGKLKKLSSGILNIRQYEQVLSTLTKLEELVAQYELGIDDSAIELVKLIKANRHMEKVGFCAGFPSTNGKDTYSKENHRTAYSLAVKRNKYKTLLSKFSM